MADMLSSSLSGLLAYRRALDTIGHNIANANTEGYSRQRVELSARPAQQMGSGFVGNGVQIDSIRRMYDEFLTADVWASTSASNRYQTYYGLSSRVDNLLADPNAGLAPSLESFYAAVHEVADDPTSHAARQVMLSEAESLVNRFHYLNQRFDIMREGLNEQLRGNLNEVSGLAKSIAQINKEIVEALGRSGGNPPNDLLDQRDMLITKLAEFVDVDTLKQQDGSLNVFIGKGQPLVIGGNAGALSASSTEPVEIYYSYGSSPAVRITESMSGGAIGGLLEFREQVLDPAQDALGRIAIGLAAAFNAQHAKGMDLNGEFGGDFFQVPEPQVTTTSAAELSVSITDASALTTSDYRVDYSATGPQWTLTRLSDGHAVSNDTGLFELDGLSIKLDSASAVPGDGDSFLIGLPDVSNAAAEIGVAITDTRQIAAAAPIRTGAHPDNLGDAKISAGEVLDPADPNLLGSVTIQFIDSTTYTADGGATTKPYTSGDDIEINGWRVQISGTPQAGDRFTVEKNVGGVGDNRNALLLADLQSAKTMLGGTADFQGAYGRMVADVGNRTRQADVNRIAQEQRLNQAEDAREMVSGVNLDEEAANLVRFQQAYQAAAQVVAVSHQLFQTLLQSFGR